MSSGTHTKLSSAALRSQLVEKIREGIVTQKYRSGDRLNETSLARDFNVSRIPVREALMQLQEQGLVMNHPRRGMFVNSMSESDTQQINGVRLVLEAEALKLCQAQATVEMIRQLDGLVTKMEDWQTGSQLEAAALDLQFHRAVWNYSGNSYLEKTLNSLSPILFAHRALDGISDERLRWILNHHRSLLDVIEGNSQTSPEEAILTHLRVGYTDPERFSSFSHSSSHGEGPVQ
ncbi:GntR family transcriptional regulator [Paracidobacterium acidisoli]|uniref:GntR family transcriptional regulator n=1 Tax=Paracidobacterium acidisoli TaxID=2303751 RepID=A0A372IKF8_9BACT|nr:GntR family transcriptional regulator [Paracidobacterium acidisoli]MBT9332963.1 GntR family transcriptional regulator [Paracidobacterium acidisoli]